MSLPLTLRVMVLLWWCMTDVVVVVDADVADMTVVDVMVAAPVADSVGLVVVVAYTAVVVAVEDNVLLVETQLVEDNQFDSMVVVLNN